jgi:hypothetical protein
MSALPPKADIRGAKRNVRFVPETHAPQQKWARYSISSTDRPVSGGRHLSDHRGLVLIAQVNDGRR